MRKLHMYKTGKKSDQSIFVSITESYRLSILLLRQ